VTVVNPLGLHARAAARFVQTASRFRCRISLRKAETSIDGKSILGVLFLAATAGTELTIIASGEDESQAADALFRLVSGGFGESE
jgi:phosphocarrier protein